MTPERRPRRARRRAGVWAGAAGAYLDILLGVALMVTAYLDAFDTVFEYWLGFNVQLWHGAAIAGFAQAVRGLADATAHLREVRESVARHRARRGSAAD